MKSPETISVDKFCNSKYVCMEEWWLEKCENLKYLTCTNPTHDQHGTKTTSTVFQKRVWGCDFIVANKASLTSRNFDNSVVINVGFVRHYFYVRNQLKQKSFTTVCWNFGGI